MPEPGPTLEELLLRGLYSARGLDSLTVADIVSAFPVTFGDSPPGEIRQAADSLAGHGMLSRQRRGGADAYRITDEGCAEIRKKDSA